MTKHFYCNPCVNTINVLVLQWALHVFLASVLTLTFKQWKEKTQKTKVEKIYIFQDISSHTGKNMLLHFHCTKHRFT